MKCKIVAVCVVAASALTLAGCGTVDNLCFPNQQTGQTPLHVYGGIEADVRFLTDSNNSAQIAKDALLPLLLLYVADLPLSLAADTATLPITLPVACYEALVHRNQPFPNSPPPNGVMPGSSIKPMPLPPEGVKFDGPAKTAPASPMPAAAP